MPRRPQKNTPQKKAKKILTLKPHPTFTKVLKKCFRKYLETRRIADKEAQKRPENFSGPTKTVLNTLQIFLNEITPKLTDEIFYQFCQKHGIEKHLAEAVRKIQKEEDLTQELVEGMVRGSISAHRDPSRPTMRIGAASALFPPPAPQTTATDRPMATPASVAPTPLRTDPAASSGLGSL